MKKKTIGVLIASLCFGMHGGAAWAAGGSEFAPFTVKDIRVEGAQRTEPGTVFSYLPVRVGDTFSEDKAAAAIKALFATGFFKDVRIEHENGVLVVLLEERQAIASIEFEGVKEFDKEQLRRGLKEIGLGESRIFDRALLDKAEQELKRQYLSRGLYGVKITTTVTPLERNRAAISFQVEEGEVARIRKINIVGNQAFSEQDLLNEITLRSPGLFTWYSKNDQYSKQKLAADLESLRAFYQNRGYLDFNIESTQVQITPDKQDIYITISILEGEKYTVSSVKLAGEMLVPEDELRKMVKIKPGEVFSRDRLTETTKLISDRLGNEGYAFANVNAAPEVDKEKRLVAFTIYLDPGRRVYVRNINIAGNSSTRDEVIRREVRQMEAAWYDAQAIAKSRTRIDRLGYFEEVSVDSAPVTGTTDQVDVNFKVKEKATGNIQLGAGFSSSEKLVLSTAISKSNIFGTGKALSAQVNTGKINQTYSLSFTDPYFTTDGVSQGFDIYKRNVDPTSLSVGNYSTSSVGGGLRWGLPISEDDYVSFGLSIDRTQITVDRELSPQAYIDFVDKVGDTTRTVLATLGWAKDGRDSVIYPTKGTYQRAYGELALPGGNLHYYRLTYQHQRFFALSRSLTLMLNGEAGYADGIGSSELPFFKNFYVGGIGSLRGFEQSSLGPRDTRTDGALGGNRKLNGSVELLFPFPGSGADKSVRLSTFIDMGQVWQLGEKLKLTDLRSSAGVALAWSSPIGPLKFSFAQPLKKEPEDRLQRFQFQLGTIF
ncbi:MAG: hypothetical protein RIR70_1533 [Pseudomonadota bacterium]